MKFIVHLTNGETVQIEADRVNYKKDFEGRESLLFFLLGSPVACFKEFTNFWGFEE